MKEEYEIKKPIWFWILILSVSAYILLCCYTYFIEVRLEKSFSINDIQRYNEIWTNIKYLSTLIIIVIFLSVILTIYNIYENMVDIECQISWNREQNENIEKLHHDLREKANYNFKLLDKRMRKKEGDGSEPQDDPDFITW